MTKRKKPTNVVLKVNIEDLRKYEAELKAKFGANTNVAFANVSMTQLSIARHYGGANVQGKFFVYNWEDDSLIREDVVAWIAKRKQEDVLQEKVAADPDMLKRVQECLTDNDLVD